MSGATVVVSGNDIIMVATAGENGAYTKIGHGDDLFSPTTAIAALAGSGTRSGDITVRAASNILLSDGMIGHVNDASGAIALDGKTQIVASEGDPTNPAGGSIVADSNSEFSGADELRFYVPERSSNDVQVGALLNGVAFVGAETDPSILQRDDEFTVNITGAAPSVPGEHMNAFNTGPAPTNAAKFAFYYNAIELIAPPVVPPVVTPGGGGNGAAGGNGAGGNGAGGEGAFGGVAQRPILTIAQALGIFPRDRTANDWQRENEGLFTGFNPFGMFFEGYDHYDTNGNPVFHFIFANQLDSSLMSPVGFEDVLERQERILEEEEEENEEEAEASAE
jgi:hypothetical protein